MPNIRTCSKCLENKVRILTGTLRADRSPRCIDDKGRVWSRGVCPDCVVIRNSIYKRNAKERGLHNLLCSRCNITVPQNRIHQKYCSRQCKLAARQDRLLAISHTNEYKARRKHNANMSRARRELRSVAWANAEKIREVYANCPDGYDVDHIIPLNGKTVSGLHVHNNLQYLTKLENSKKSNRFEGNGNA